MPILERHAEMVRAMDEDLREQVSRLLSVDRLGELWLPARAAELVLCLLRVDTARSVSMAESLIGRPIQRLPPPVALLRRPLPPQPRQRAGDDRRVLWSRSPAMLRVVAGLRAANVIPPRSRLMSLTGRSKIVVSTSMYDRMAEMRPGRTVAEILSRGVTRRDLRIASRRGWMEIEP